MEQTAQSTIEWVDAFLRDRAACGVSWGTLHFYRVKFNNVKAYLQAAGLDDLNQITPDVIRSFFVSLADHAPGDIHAHYRALKAFFHFYQVEAEPAGWVNPMLKVKPPKRSATLLPPVEIETVRALAGVCGPSPIGLRDHAILFALLDSGARAQELLDLDRPDVNLLTGTVAIRHGKGDKSRTVFIGKATRLAIRRYLRTRGDDNPILWLSENGDRLTYWGLRGMIERRSGQAGVDAPTLHSFRRAFALSCLRQGMDIYSLQLLMGHSDLQTLRRYLAQTDEDLRKAHARFSPGDTL